MNLEREVIGKWKYYDEAVRRYGEE